MDPFSTCQVAALWAALPGEYGRVILVLCRELCRFFRLGAVLHEGDSTSVTSGQARFGCDFGGSGRSKQQFQMTVLGQIVVWLWGLVCKWGDSDR
jgi:hypothetical protein